jgi:predicted TIM-barrel fold metal-dependent hydrolase
MLDFASLEDVLKSYPGIPFIGHGPLFWKEFWGPSNPLDSEQPSTPGRWGVTCQLIAKFPNLYADISADSGMAALHRNRSLTKWFLDTYRDKVIFGTDNRIIGQEEFVMSLGLETDVMRKLMGRNAAILV